MLCRTRVCSWETQNRGLSMEQKDAHPRVTVGRGLWAGHLTPVPTREASKVLPCQCGLQPSTAQAFLETFTPPCLLATEVSGIFQEPQVCSHSWLRGWSNRGAVKSSRPPRPPRPPAAVSGDPRPRVSLGGFPPDGQPQLPPTAGPPHAKEAALCHLYLAPASASVARATLEVMFDPKGAPY